MNSLCIGKAGVDAGDIMKAEDTRFSASWVDLNFTDAVLESFGPIGTLFPVQTGPAKPRCCERVRLSNRRNLIARHSRALLQTHLLYVAFAFVRPKCQGPRSGPFNFYR